MWVGNESRMRGKDDGLGERTGIYTMREERECVKVKRREWL